jgi:hypothetical protein
VASIAAERPVGEGARGRLGVRLGCIILLVALASCGLAAGATAPPTGVWRATGNQFKGTFKVSGRHVTNFHGIALAGAHNGCPVVHPGETVVLPARIPITHILSSQVDYYDVQAKSKVADELLLNTVVIVGGARHAGAIQIIWKSQTEASVSITYGDLAKGCHIFFSVVPATR